MKKIFALMLSLFLFTGCAAKLATKDVGRDYQSYVTQREVQTGLVNNRAEEQQTGLVNAQAQVGGKHDIKQQNSKGDNNTGWFSGGGLYLTIVSIVAIVSPPLLLLAIFYVWIRQKRGLKAFSLLKEAHEEVADKDTSSIPSEVMALFKQKAKETKDARWMKKNKAIFDMFDDDED